LRLGPFCNTHVEIINSSSPLTARTLPAFNSDEAERNQLLDAALNGIDALLGARS
jgi:hypothetical protein